MMPVVAVVPKQGVVRTVAMSLSEVVVVVPTEAVVAVAKGTGAHWYCVYANRAGHTG